MTSTDLIPAALLARKAVVYVRQSSQSQVMTNLESQRRQYDLVDLALDIEVIDDDLGRSASGTVARSGFDRLVAWLCAGKVGAVLCFDASRLARNGRDWHHLLELCGLVCQLHGASMTGQIRFRKKLSRQNFSKFMAEHPPALVVMEACGSAH